MLLAFLVSLGLFQYRIDAVRGAEATQRVSLAQTTQTVRTSKTKTEEQRREFEKKFNRLITAIDEFQKEYNASGGEVWPQ